MSTAAPSYLVHTSYPVQVHVAPATEHRNRLTTAFRIILAIPHLILVGGPMAFVFTGSRGTDTPFNMDWGAGGVLGTVAFVCAVIAWFAILFTGRYPSGLRTLVEYYLRWRVRAIAYVTLLRDEYPPFGRGSYPVSLELHAPEGARDRLTVAFRLILAIPHLIVVWLLGIAWCVTTIIAWFAILFTGRYPASLFQFGVGALRWTTRVEAYLLLLHDAYPPFALDAP